MNAVSPDDLAAQVLEDSGYMEMLKMDKSAEAEGRIENLKDLINVMSDTEQYRPPPACHQTRRGRLLHRSMSVW